MSASPGRSPRSRSTGVLRKDESSFSCAGLSKTPPFDADGHRQELRRRLQTIALVEIREDQLDKYPSIPISAVQDVEDFERFIDAMDWVIREVAPDTSSK